MQSADADMTVPSGTQPPPVAVSPGNPCPMLRALVAEGFAPDRGLPPSALADLLAKARGGPADKNRSFRRTALVVALIGNGLWPWQILRTWQTLTRLDALRDGPLDKHSAGSRILDLRAVVVPTELDRIGSFASNKTAPDGTTEPGLDATEIKAMMDANYARAAGHRRWIDRLLMKGEFPILLRIFGKPSAQGDYLSVAEVRTLFLDLRLPDRIRDRITS